MSQFKHILIVFVLFGLEAAGQTPEITGITSTNGQIRITWTDGLAPYQVVEVPMIHETNGVVVAGPIDARETTVAVTQAHSFFRIEALGEPASLTATYSVSFKNTWNAANHPDRFPAGDHYSFFVGAVHRSSVSFWSPGTLASLGMKNMAEFGSNTALLNEFSNSIHQGHASSIFNLSTQVNASQAFPLVTMVAMIAPSPDWFVGVHDLPLFDGTNWVEDLTVQLYPYDAGTDSGSTYTSLNLTTSPRQNISQITGAPFLNNGELRPMGSFRFLRQQASP